MVNCEGILVPEIPEEKEFLDGCKTFPKADKDALYYTVATAHVSDHLNEPIFIANGVGLLLLNWNWNYYKFGKREGPLDFVKLEICISKNCVTINNFRSRDISTLSENDTKGIRKLFNDFLEATKRVPANTENPPSSKVSAGKALHVLAPTFFPLWDSSIADKYAKFSGKKYETKCEEYIYFCRQIKCIHQHLRNCQGIKNYEILSKKTLIKLIDEYNYSKYSV